MPMVKTMLEEEFGKPPRSSPNPDETVARGAAVYAATLAARGQKLAGSAAGPAQRLGPIDVRDVTSHTLGTLAKSDDRFVRSAIIRKNAHIPCRETRSDYATGRDNQDSLVVPVLQGESEDPTKCDLIACWEFFGIPPRPAGQSTLRVTFGYDTNGVVEVEAEDVQSGKSLKKRAKEISGIEELIAPPQPPVRAVLCLDVSGSMHGRPLREAQRGAIDFVQTLLGSTSAGGTAGGVGQMVERMTGIQLGKRLGGSAAADIQMGLVSFHGRASVECELVGDASKLTQKIESLGSGGGTNIAAGIETSHHKVFGRVVREAKCELVLFTDGGSSAGPAIAAAKAAKEDGIVIRTIGCGSGVDRDLLSKIASSKDQADFISGASQIRSSLANVAVQISQGLRTR